MERPASQQRPTPGPQVIYPSPTLATTLHQPQIQNLGASPNLDATVGSWPGAGAGGLAGSPAAPAPLDAELPDFRGRPVRTGSNLASMSRNASFTGPAPVGAGAAAAVAAAAVAASAGGLLSREGSFSADSFFNAANSAPITPRSPATPLFDLAAAAAAAAAAANAGQQLDAAPSSSAFGKVRAHFFVGQPASAFVGDKASAHIFPPLAC